MKIAITGFGAEGQSSYKYWNTPGNELVIVDEREDAAVPEGVESILGADAFRRLGGFDLIIRSPGVRLDKLPYGEKVWSATNEFFAHCPVPIIGVTGTKGKGTTSSLIAAILRATGKTVHLVGNIGTPALEALASVQPEDIVVYELSSFQLWDLKKSPAVAVVLGIEPDHLDVHTDYADYIAAKARIAEYQVTTDRVLYDADNEASAAVAKLSVGQRLPYMSERTAHIRGDFFYYNDTELCAVDELQLVGGHNRKNACAAIAAVWPWAPDPAAVAEGLRSFSGLPHRLQFVREVSGVKYFDDSIATTPGSAIAALRAFSEPKIIILGGSDKGAEYSEVVQLCGETGTRVIAIGQTGLLIQELCATLGIICERVEGYMPEVVEKAHEMATPGDMVILSPASASFDQYRSYADRGEQFITAVQSLAENESSHQM